MNHALRAILETWIRDGHSINLLLSDGKSIDRADSILDHLDQLYFTWVCKRGDNLSRSIPALHSKIREKLYFYFPLRNKFGDGNMSAALIRRQLLNLKEMLPEFKVRAPLGIEIWNNRIDPELCLEPIEQIAAECRSPNPQILVSVVIPTYNNCAYLMQTLGHLVEQNIGNDLFEIVVVDDGSTDNTHLNVLKFIKNSQSSLNCKYIYFPRNKPRQMGDRNFRAGVARNLGVKNAGGKILCFLDSDIITPKDFLKDLAEKHESFDVVQCVRLNLHESASGSDVKFENILPERDTFFTDGRYWETFFEVSDWQSLPFYWKYTCTYGLSMKKELFESMGWLKRTFIYYGFEDTELGYRLANAGCSFHLNKKIVYHLFHGNVRSEYSNQDWQRHLLLSKTARIFYHQVLDIEVFEHFRIFLDEGLGFISNFFEQLYLIKFPFKPKLTNASYETN